MKASVMTVPDGPEVLKFQDLPYPALNRDAEFIAHRGVHLS